MTCVKPPVSDEIDGAALHLEPDSEAAELVERFPDLRNATLVVAVRLTAQATLQRGIWPLGAGAGNAGRDISAAKAIDMNQCPLWAGG